MSSQESAIKNTDTVYGRIANMFYKNGEVVDKFVGAAPKAVLEEKIKALL